MNVQQWNGTIISLFMLFIAFEAAALLALVGGGLPQVLYSAPVSTWMGPYGHHSSPSPCEGTEPLRPRPSRSQHTSSRFPHRGVHHLVTSVSYMSSYGMLLLFCWTSSNGYQTLSSSRFMELVILLARESKRKNDNVQESRERQSLRRMISPGLMLARSTSWWVSILN